MRLRLFHPGLLERPCSQCKLWMYDDPAPGKGPIQSAKKALHQGQPIARPPGLKTPCHNCPKGSPEQAEGAENALGRAAWVMETYYRAQATFGRNMPELRDRLVIEHLGIVAQMIERKKSNELLEGLQLSVGRGAVQAALRGMG